VYKVDTGGLRNEVELTQHQVDKAIDYAIKLGMEKDSIRYSSNTNTVYIADWDFLVIGTDLYPLAERTDYPNSNISWRGTLFHEIVGHRESCQAGRVFVTSEEERSVLAGVMPKEDFVERKALDEVQASLRASVLGLSLTALERQDLWDDAMARLVGLGIDFEQVKNKFYLERKS